LPEVPVDGAQNLAFYEAHVIMHAILYVLFMHTINISWRHTWKSFHSEPYCAEHPCAFVGSVYMQELCIHGISCMPFGASVFTEPLERQQQTRCNGQE
tara:strand:- start:197 stop:490 length:294 start_codon:yes stop_codon:yes gene_type:complete